ncbi:hypothetical protein PRUPE_2G160200 [Prunus persica]|uniref:Uncharacterized protein n=1 Tax=Prunus persica TaxID=3760 RepID=A0A251QJW5_PRUPE|nr:hypothetical protein PRUPE_2G160200 [Prunus persica]
MASQFSTAVTTERRVGQLVDLEVGAAVLRAAVAEELAEGHCDVVPRELMYMSKEESLEYVSRSMWFPVYSPLVHEK